MILSTININRCGRWQKIRLIFNAIGCCKFGTISAGTRPTCSNMLVVKCCGCIHPPIPSSHLQLHHFNQIAVISTTTKLLTKAGALAGNEQPPKPSQSIGINESQEQTKSSPETAEEKEEQKQQNETDEPQHVKLAKASIAIGPNRNIEIECHQGASGHRFIKISRLPNIPVPQDAYKFVTALDRLISKLPVENPANSENIGSHRVLAFQMLEKGQHNDFTLSIVWHPERGQWHLRIRSVKTRERHTEREAHFPLSTLPQLRQQMATMLEEHDGTERIDEMPTMPEWAKQEEQRDANAETETEGTKEQIPQQPPHFNLSKNSLDVGQNRQLELECRQGSSGQKTINISMLIPKEPIAIHIHLPKIQVPQAAYKFLGALDGLIGQLPAEAPANPEGNKRPILARQMADENSQRYGYKLSVVWHQKDGQWHLYIKSVQTSKKHMEREVHFPLWALPLLRQQMATILEEYDGTERIDQMPAIPEWVTLEKEEEAENNEETDGGSKSGPNDSGVPVAQPQQQIDEQKVVELAKSFLPLGRNRKLQIECYQGKGGHKTIQIYIHSEQKPKLPRALHVALPKIHVPEEAYKFVAAMDRLIGQLPVVAPANPSIANESPQILANQMVEGGIFYDFQLSVLWFERGGPGQWDLKIRSVKTVKEHNEGGVQMQLWTLPLLRQKIAVILENVDGTQRIDEMPTMPEWATQSLNIRLKSRLSN